MAPNTPNAGFAAKRSKRQTRKSSALLSANRLVDHPIVLLHGTNARPWTMINFYNYFTQRGFDVYTPSYRFHDLPDGDERTKALQNVSVADYEEDIAQFLEDTLGENQPRPVVIGHSLGGLIAQILAGRGLVEASVLVNSSIIHGTQPTTEAERSLNKILFSSDVPLQDQVCGLDLDLMSEFALNTMPDSQQKVIVDKLSTESGRVLFEIFGWVNDVNKTTKVDIHSIVNKYKTPLLFLTATEDIAIPPSTARQVARRYGEDANVTVVEVPGRCHYMQLEDGWEDIAETALNWISKNM